ncbi:methyltransferase, FxLD system [Spongiactinospora rosea]|uniref:methyltransferase, FxLD system n=1 Tax=Spongiactinospora rosea TaxID=2248750 RepID=UPI0018F30C93|nr:methyltransferase, FxLD system [Spongiactinospora rosea]
MTDVTTDSSTGQARANAELLREELVRDLREQGAIRSEAVAAAVATVPRHVFLPGETLAAAYAADNAPIVKSDGHGLTLSSVSAVHLQATMLEAAGIEPGMNVCEVGSGGYNAALMAELVGEHGRVTTVDIDPDITERARAFLDEAGYSQVEVVLADAEHGVPGRALFDRIIVTAGSWDIPPAWLEQLSAGGRIIVPLRLKGTTRWISFDRDHTGGLVSRGYGLCVFVPFQGAGSHAERSITMEDGVVLHLDDENVQLDAGALRAALHQPRIERWSGALFDMPDEQMLFLLTNDPAMALLYADQPVIDRELLARPALRGVPVLVGGDSFAYRAARPNDEMSSGYESGVYAHGPAAEDIADRYVGLLRRWADKYHRRGAASIQYLPELATPPVPSSGVITKRHGTVVVTWP